MARVQRATTAKQKSIVPPGDSGSSLSDISGEIAKSETLGSQSVEAKKSSVSTTITKEERTVRTTVKVKPKPKSKGKKRKAGSDDNGSDNKEPTTRKKARNSTRENIVEMLPLATRVVGMKMLVGAHVSMAKETGVQNAITNCNNIGGNAFALFLRPQRKWASPDLKEFDAVAFRDGCRKSRFDPKRHILPHGSYLINLAQGDEEKAKQAYSCFIDDLKRCERLGIGMYNFHPGSTLGLPRPEALARIAAHLNRAHKETKFVKTVLENMAGQGNIIGANFEDLRDIIEQVKDKDRVGVCLDTCHLFAAGHDIRTQASYDTVIANFNRTVGQKYLVALHLNDSKAPLGANLDRHQNIGVGFLGLEAFRVLMNDKRLEGLPMILETPMKVEKTWADEIKLLESLVGSSADDPDFLTKAAELSTIGQGERKTAGVAAEKKKTTKKAPKAQKKASKKQLEESGSGDEEGHVCQH